MTQREDLRSAPAFRDRHAMTTALSELDGYVVGRDRELAVLSGALNDAARRGGLSALISGAPGMGKSTLVQAFGARASARGGVFGYGRCSEGSRIPYSAPSQALAGVVRAMAATGGTERDRWGSDLRRGMSATTAGALCALVPGLDTVLDAGPAAEIDATGDGRRRLQRAAARLLTVTASYRPLVLAVDDLQWADDDSLLLLGEVLATPIRDVLVVGAYRAGEFDPAPLGGDPTRVTHLEPGLLAVAEIEEMVAVGCGTAPALAEVAAEFHRLTAGNPLEVRQLLLQSQRAGVLVLGDGRPPAWNVPALTAIAPSTNAAAFLGRSLGELSSAERDLLATWACIGAEFDLEDAVTAAGRPSDVVAPALWAALRLRLLDALDDGGRRVTPVLDRSTRYRVSHDRVAELARARLSDAERSEVHLRLGRRLAGQGTTRLFEAARHLAIGGLALPEGPERAGFAEVTRQAARLARRRASLPAVDQYCRGGLALLGARRWPDHPATTRELQLLWAETALLTADTDLLEELLAEAERELQEPADRAHIAFLRLKAQLSRHELQDALDTGLRVLEQVGHPLPPDPGNASAAGALLRWKITMSRWDDDRLLALPHCTDRLVQVVQLILEELLNAAYLSRPGLFPLIVGKQLELTLARGLVVSSPVALASYGVLRVVLGDTVGGQRFGEVGLRMAERAEFREAHPRVMFLHANFIRHWRHPMRENLPLLRASLAEALDRGDVECAGRLATTVLYQSFWAGRPLPEIDALAEWVIPETGSSRTMNTLCRSTQQFCLNLMGRSDDPFLLAGESGYDERVEVPIARRENDVVGQSAAAISRFGLRFWCGDDAGGIPLAEETAEFAVGMSGMSNLQLYHFANALSRIRAAPTDRATARAVRRAVRLHRGWAAVGPANYAAPDALLRGVWDRARGRLRSAERHLDRAIALAERHEQPLFIGRANEEAATLYAMTGRGSLSRLMVQAAYEQWLSLGMSVRSNLLERSHPWLLSRALAAGGTDGGDRSGSRRLTRAMAGAPSMDALAQVLLGTVADTTGASRVLLLTGEGVPLAVRAVCEGGAVGAPGGAGAIDVDTDAIRAAARDERPVLGGAGSSAGAVLVVPVVARATVIGAVYAEHREPGRVFGSGHQDAVAALCAQASMTLWGFELTDRLRRADEDHQSLVAAQSRFFPVELLGLLDVSDLSRVRRGHRVEREMTVLIADIRGYTGMLEAMTVAEASELMAGFLAAVEIPIVSNNGLLQDVRGDEILALFDGGPDDALAAGLAMLRALRAHNADRVARGSEPLQIGIGVNTGVVGLGLMGGVNRLAITVIGDAVNLASRVESTTKRYGSELLVSGETVAALTGPGRFDVRRMERVMVVNRRQPVTIHEVFDEDPDAVRAAKRAARPLFEEAFARYDEGDRDGARAEFERCRAALPDDPVAPLHLTLCDSMEAGGEVPGPRHFLAPK